MDSNFIRARHHDHDNVTDYSGHSNSPNLSLYTSKSESSDDEQSLEEPQPVPADPLLSLARCMIQSTTVPNNDIEERSLLNNTMDAAIAANVLSGLQLDLALDKYQHEAFQGDELRMLFHYVNENVCRTETLLVDAVLEIQRSRNYEELFRNHVEKIARALMSINDMLCEKQRLLQRLDILQSIFSQVPTLETEFVILRRGVAQSLEESPNKDGERHSKAFEGSEPSTVCGRGLEAEGNTKKINKYLKQFQYLAARTGPGKAAESEQLLKDAFKELNISDGTESENSK